MPSTTQWIAFLVASFVFVQVPGPSLLFTIGRALTVGRRDALLSACGNAVGVVFQVLLIAVGLGALVAASATLFTAVKLCGAAYVVWLGVQAIRHRQDARIAMREGRGPVRRGAVQSLRTGMLVGATNPKTLVFIMAFLPQFVDTHASHTAPQLALLGVVFCVLACCSDSVWVLLASRAREWFGRRPERLDGLGVAGGAMMIGLGAVMVASE